MVWILNVLKALVLGVGTGMVLLGGGGSFENLGLVEYFWVIKSVPMKGIIEPCIFYSLLFSWLAYG
jgi:hypothetical protein